MSRLRPDTGFSIGQSSTITRDEVKFSKFISRLRNKFAGIFANILRVQLIAKGIIREDEWDEIFENIKFTFNKDNHYSELKDAEIIQNRLATLLSIDPYIGRYFSIEWVRKNVLMQTEDEIKEIDKQIKAEPTPVDPNQQ
jgi:hypothetical protein